MKKNENLTLASFLDVKEFKTIVTATLKLAAEDKQLLVKPSVALKIGHSLQKYISVIKSKTLTASDDESFKAIERFQKLLFCDWSVYVSARALNPIKEAKLNKPEELPVESDLLTVELFLEVALSKIPTRSREDINEN